jgi:hypothetical protein
MSIWAQGGIFRGAHFFIERRLSCIGFGWLLYTMGVLEIFYGFYLELGRVVFCTCILYMMACWSGGWFESGSVRSISITIRFMNEHA